MSRTFAGGAATADVRVTARPPLSLPPDFNRRPDPAGAAQTSPPVQAAAAPGPISSGQMALLSATGPAAPANIRAKVSEDAQVDITNHALTDELMSWRRPADQPPLIERNASKGLLSRIF